MRGQQLLWSNAVIALGALGCVPASWSLTGLRPSFTSEDWIFAGGIGTATWLAYTWQRHVKSTRPDGLRAAHRAWHRHHWPTLRFISLMLVPIAALPGCMLFRALDGWGGNSALMGATLLLASVLTLLYAGLPGTEGVRYALRRLPRLKLLWIGLVWALVTTGWPIWWKPGPHTIPMGEAILLMSERACVIMALTLPFDLRDVHWDPKVLCTIPQMFGASGTRLAALLLLASACIARWLLMEGNLAVLAGPGIMMGAVILADEHRPPLYFSLLDGLLIADAIWLMTTV